MFEVYNAQVPPPTPPRRPRRFDRDGRRTCDERERLAAPQGRKASRRNPLRNASSLSYRLCSPSPLRSALTSGSGGPGWGIHKPRRPRYPLRWRARAGPKARPGKRSPSALLWPPMASPRPYRGGRTLFPGQQPSRRRRCRLKARTTPQRFFNHLRRLTETSR
jgi:hypothetical protein